jgi:hypothetical protein
MRKLAGLDSDSEDDDVIPDDDSKIKQVKMHDQVMGTSDKKLIMKELGAIFDDDEQSDSVDTKKRTLEEEIEFEHPEIPTYSELFWNIFFMPLIIYAGLGRVVVLSERKTFLTQFS